MAPSLGSDLPTFLTSASAGRWTPEPGPRKELQHLLRFLFLPQERSQDAAHLCVRVPLIFSEEHHSNCSFALTQPQPCMQLGELCSLVPRKSTQWPQDLLPGADGCWGWGCILDTAWTAQLDNKAVFPTAMAHSQSHYPALWDSLGTPSLQHQGGLPTNQREMHGPRYQTSLKVHS